MNDKGRLSGIDRVRSRFGRKHPLIDATDAERARRFPFVAHPAAPNVVPIRDQEPDTVTVEITVSVDAIDPDDVVDMVETIETAASQWEPKVTFCVKRY